MGSVFLAEDHKESRAVAVKFLKPGLDREAVDLFREEVLILSRLSHPSLVQVFDYYESPSEFEVGTDAPSSPCFTMELVDGVPIGSGRRSLKAKTMLDVFAQTCRGLHYLHTRGILHRDLKPSNILISDDRVKILDFGLATAISKMPLNHAVGTLDYLAPEARAGVFTPQSDLYALGLIFRNVLERCVGVPSYFRELILRLLESDPSRRPASALSALKYLREHAGEAVALPEDEKRSPVLQRIPWVHRAEEDAFWQAANESSFLIRLMGPTGIGRTRFLDEVKWKFELAGRPCHSLQAKDLATAAAMNGVLFFPDLHSWAEEDLKRLRLLLKSPQAPKAVILEFNTDFLTDLEIENSISVRMNDLPLDATLEMIRMATADAPVSDERARDIALKTGGRPLLVTEALKEDGKGIPTNLASACALRADTLSAAGRRLLALVASETSPVPFPKAFDLWKGLALSQDENKFWDAQLELQSQGILSHPSLRTTYFNALSLEERLDAHRQWIRYLTAQHAHPETSEDALRIARHALAANDAETCRLWGSKAVDFVFTHGHYEETLVLSDDLLKLTLPDIMRSLLYSYEAPAFYRLGRFDEAVTAYDRWHALKPDDGTGVEVVKHRLLTGLAYFGAGRIDDAAKAFELCLKAGDDARFPHHRPYHARAHSRLAVLAEKDGRHEEALRRLNLAAALAQGQPVLLGEIEQQRAHMLQSKMSYPTAIANYEMAAMHYAQAENPQAEAIALQGIAMTLREQGHLTDALAVIDRSLELAAAGGDILQLARYRGNRALILKDLARYGSALEDGRTSRNVLDIYGDREDRSRATEHATALDIAIGHWDRAEQSLERLADHPLLKADLAYRRGDYAGAAKHFERAVVPQAPFECLQALLGIFRCGARLGTFDAASQHAFAALKPLHGPFFETWRALLSLLFRPSTEDISESELVEAMERIQSAENPEERVEMYTLLALNLERRGLKKLAHYIHLASSQDLMKIFEQLPEELKMDFEKNRDLKTIDRALADVLPKADVSQKAISEARFRQYCEINRQIALKSDPNEILERVLDAAIEMTGAERGFVLLKDGLSGNPILPGFDVKAARRLNRKSLQEKEFSLSLSAVRQCIDRGTDILTDDAQMDPRFREQQSVMKFGLKAMLVVPLESDGEVIGAIYLDHRYQPNCFRAEDILLLNAFAAQAALAVQKARMLDELAEAKKKLEGEVEEQAVHIAALTDELSKARTQLRYGYEEIVGQSPAMMKVFQLLDNVTDTAIPVWIWGESGTGKELVARSLHFNSHRKNAPFVAENVSAIPETLLESELFGHKKGAFTHADRDRVGLFEQANGGTLFLDEVADMSLAMQAKLLRVLQESEVRPVGSGKKIKIDVRLVTASNKDLNKLVKAEKFREDLFFRINGLTITLPPLRERKDDLPLLADHIVRKMARDFHLPSAALSGEALQILLRHDWPGNVRELEATLRNALLFAKGANESVISPKFLVIGPQRETPEREKRPTSTAAAPIDDEDAQERQLILEALKRCRLNKEAAAHELGISLRSLYVRMGRFKIPKKKPVLEKYLGLK